MPHLLVFGEYQVIINTHIETPSLRRHQGNVRNLGFKVLQEFGRQTDSSICVVSNCTVNDPDGVFHDFSLWVDSVNGKL